MKLKTYTSAEMRELRRKLGLNQFELWSPFQITQSGGSRHESWREIPDPVQQLLNIAFGTDAAATAIIDELRTIGNPKEKPEAGHSETT